MNNDSEMERLLSSLTPAETQINRDRLLYAVGARKENQKLRRRIWQFSTAAALVLSIGLVGILIGKVDRTGSRNSAAGSSEVARIGGRGPDSPLRMRSELSFQKDFTADAESSFSRIHLADAWGREELEDRGISVLSWEPMFQTEDPPISWTQISFDRSTAFAGRDVVITAWIVSDEGIVQCALRNETGVKETEDASLIVLLGDEYQLKSYVEILIWSHMPDGAREATGYRLSAQRIGELVDDVAGVKHDGSEDELIPETLE